MTQMNDTQQQMAEFGSALIQPYVDQIESDKAELDRLRQENQDLKSKLQPFLNMLPLIEREDTFHLKLNADTFGANKLRRLAVLSTDLYPKLTKRWLEWKNGGGGTRPKDPMRQFIMNTLELFIDRPDWIRATFKSGGCKHHRDE